MRQLNKQKNPVKVAPRKEAALLRLLAGEQIEKIAESLGRTTRPETVRKWWALLSPDQRREIELTHIRTVLVELEAEHSATRRKLDTILAKKKPGRGGSDGSASAKNAANALRALDKTLGVTRERLDALEAQVTPARRTRLRNTLKTRHRDGSFEFMIPKDGLAIRIFPDGRAAVSRVEDHLFEQATTAESAETTRRWHARDFTDEELEAWAESAAEWNLRRWPESEAHKKRRKIESQLVGNAEQQDIVRRKLMSQKG